MAKRKAIWIIASVLVIMVTAALGGFCALALENSGVFGSEEPQEEVVEPQTEVVEEEMTVDRWIASTVSDTVVGVSNMASMLGIDGSTSVVEAGAGSGVIVDSRGYIVTNNHVIDKSESIVVTLADGSQHAAKLVGSDAYTDIALLKINVDDLPAATLGNSDLLEVGDKAVAIGNPGGLDFAGSVTSGIISGLDRPLVTEEGIRFKLVQTDAAINPGNSGGALVNREGEVIGINTIKISEAGFEGMGFALPANLVKEIMAELLEKGKITRPALGVYLLRNIDAELNAYFKFGTDHGVLISVQEDGPADLAGLAEYDIIVSIDGEDVTDVYDCQETIFGHQVGDSVVINFVRDGEQLETTVKLGELQEEEDESQDTGNRQGQGALPE